MELFPDRPSILKHQMDIHGFIPPIIKRDPHFKSKRKSKPKIKPIPTPKTVIIEPLICNICDKSFISRKKFNEHMLCHTKPFKCKHCNKAFGKKWNLKVHERIHKKQQDNDIRKLCKFCGKLFRDPSDIKKHIQSVHCNENGIGIKPFRCRKCLKGFKRKDGLKKHLQSHETREKRNLFKCSFCEQKFVFNHNRLKHERVVHAIRQ